MGHNFNSIIGLVIRELFGEGKPHFRQGLSVNDDKYPAQEPGAKDKRDHPLTVLAS
jgi:hypothetical protein